MRSMDLGNGRSSSSGEQTWFVGVMTTCGDRGYMFFRPFRSVIVHMPADYSPLNDGLEDCADFPELTAAVYDKICELENIRNFAEGIHDLVIIGMTRLDTLNP